MNNSFFKVEKLDNDWIEYFGIVTKYDPQKTYVIEVQNTKAIDKDLLLKLPENVKVRVVGPYDEERINAYKGYKYTNGRVISEDYTNSVIYTRNEIYNILTEIERIEKGIDSRWNKYQVLMYFYNILKRMIMYDPKYEEKSSEEVRSLRGLLTKKTVCAGYAVILKELLDRNGINCRYIQGLTSKDGGHAWNIVEIDGNEYGIDLTWDNSRFRNGNFSAVDNFARNPEDFNKNHIPDKKEPYKDYQSRLKSIKIEHVKNFMDYLNVETSFNNRTYGIKRSDGSYLVVAQVSSVKQGNDLVYSYYCYESFDDGKKGVPSILYSKINLAKYVDDKAFKRDIPQGLENAIKLLFSKENIEDSNKKGTRYLGSPIKNKYSNKTEYIKDLSEITKEEYIGIEVSKQSKALKRSNGSYIYFEAEYNYPIDIEGNKVYCFRVYEEVNGVIKGVKVYSEENFFLDNRQSFIDNFLGRSRLEKKVIETGGYIGYLDKDGIIKSNNYLNAYFKDEKNVSKTKEKIIEAKKKKEPQITESVIPTFEELKTIVSKYELVTKTKSGKVEYYIKDKNDKTIVTDPMIFEVAMFANIWLQSAGVKKDFILNDKGMKYAFNDGARKLYYDFCRRAIHDCQTKGVIDTVSIFKNVDDSYKYNEEIICNLFRTNYQSRIINSLFMRAANLLPTTSQPVALYTMGHATSLAYEDVQMIASQRR